MGRTGSEGERRPAPLRHAAQVRAWRWRVAAASEPIEVTWTLPVADAVYAALTETGWTLRGSRRLPMCLHGPDKPKEKGWNHEHAFILPQDADGDGLIDHISVSAAMGLDPAALRLLAATDRLVLTNGAAVELVLERAGGFEAAGETGPSRIWISRTPYLPPNRRPRFDIKDAAKQLRNEIGRRARACDPEKWRPVFGDDHAQIANLERDGVSTKGRPAPGADDGGESAPDTNGGGTRSPVRRRAGIAPPAPLGADVAERALPPVRLTANPVALPHIGDGAGRLAPADFHLEADDGARPPPGSAPCFFRLEFEQPVCGPLAFGWQCHRGLGQFGAVGYHAPA